MWITRHSAFQKIQSIGSVINPHVLLTTANRALTKTVNKYAVTCTTDSWYEINRSNIINSSAGFVSREIISAQSRYFAWKCLQLWISFTPPAEQTLLHPVMQAIMSAPHYCRPWELRGAQLAPLALTTQSVKNLVLQSCWFNSRKEDHTVSVIRLYGNAFQLYNAKYSL